MRECTGGAADQGCVSSILIDAEALGRQYEQQAEESISGIKALLQLLGEYKGRKTVVLVSAGMPVSDRPGGWNSEGGEAVALGHEAARAQATIYSLHIDRGYSKTYAAETRGARNINSRARERELEERLLNQFAVASGGAMFSAPTGSGESALDRLLLETSSVYLLGVSPERLDLDGRTHQLKVKVTQRGATARQPAVCPPSSHNRKLDRRPGSSIHDARSGVIYHVHFSWPDFPPILDLAVVLEDNFPSKE